MTLNPGSRLYADLSRHGLMWAWRLTLTTDEGTEVTLASGANWRRRNARNAAEAWARLWVRRYESLKD